MTSHVVVDGSNIATEGNTLPSLEQLNKAVEAFLAEHPHDIVTVVVDATFGHRIESKERRAYEQAITRGDLITPPAGAIGRGDAFILQIADRAGATVFSNDSFQEFHGDYAWLFDDGRLIGGKPVPHVGWVFVARTPVRGPTSRRATRTAKRATSSNGSRGRTGSRGTTSRAGSSPRSTPSPRSGSPARSSAEEPTADPVPSESPSSSGTGKPRRRHSNTTPLNDPLPFIEFVAANPLGATVTGAIEKFSSHGAYVRVDDTLCYLPTSSIADPPPRSARELFSRGDVAAFVVEAIDTPRRSIDLALPTMARASAGAAADVDGRRDDGDDDRDDADEDAASETDAPRPAQRRRRTSRASAAETDDASEAVESARDGATPDITALRPRRRRRRGSPPANVPDSSSGAETEVDDGEAAASEPAEPVTEDRPRRRRRRATADAETAADAAEDTAPAAEETKPARRRRTTRAAAAKAEDTPAADAAEDTAPADEPKPTRRRRTTRAAEAEAEDAAPADEPKPARRRRTTKTAAAKAEDATAADAAEDTAPAAEEPKPTRRRRTTKTAATAGSPPAEASNGHQQPDHLDGLELSAKGTVRVGALARHLGVSPTALLAHAEAVGVPIKSNLSSVAREQAVVIAERVATSAGT